MVNAKIFEIYVYNVADHFVNNWVNSKVVISLRRSEEKRKEMVLILYTSVSSYYLNRFHIRKSIE